MLISLSLGAVVAVGFTALAVRYWRRGKQWASFLVLLIGPAGVVAAAVGGEYVQWEIDQSNGWHSEISAEEDGLVVSLVQTAGVDFYETKLEVVLPDGQVSSVVLDVDDGKWWNGRVVRENGTFYFLEGSGGINQFSPFWDPVNETIGGYKVSETRISELKFE